MFTGMAGAALGGTAAHVYGAAAYTGIVMIALLRPAAITAQVIGGQLLTASLLLESKAPAAVLLLLMVGSIVVTAELLGVAARLALPIERDTRDDLLRGAVAAAAGGGVFGVMLLVSAIPGPTGLPSGILAIIAASGACVLLAIVLVSSRFAPHE